MQISTTARHCELDPEDRLFAQQRLEKLSRYVRDAREAHLTVTAEKYRHTAEILLKLKHREIVSREQSTEPRMAIGAHLLVVVDDEDHGASASRTLSIRPAREKGFSIRLTPASRVPPPAATTSSESTRTSPTCRA